MLRYNLLITSNTITVWYLTFFVLHLQYSRSWSWKARSSPEPAQPKNVPAPQHWPWRSDSLGNTILLLSCQDHSEYWWECGWRELHPVRPLLRSQLLLHVAGLQVGTILMAISTRFLTDRYFLTTKRLSLLSARKPKIAMQIKRVYDRMENL